jgi:DNA invertase Pin-like site-specific DNA recombinase
MTISSALEPLDEVVSSLTGYRRGFYDSDEAVAHALETGEVPMRRASKRLFVFAPKRIVIGPGDRIEPDDLSSWRSITITRSNGRREVFHGVAVDRAALEVQFKERHVPHNPDVIGTQRASMLIGYARTSTEEQLAGLEAQVAALNEEGCTKKIFQERVSSMAQRDQLEAALEFAREGDTLVVTKMDRLARSTQHLLEIVENLEAKGVALRILDFKGDKVDTNSPQGKLILTMFAAFAQFERELVLERQRAGIAKAKAEGLHKGRKPTALAKAGEVKALAADGVGPSEIARRLAIGRTSVYRVLHG